MKISVIVEDKHMHIEEKDISWQYVGRGQLCLMLIVG